MPHSPFLPPRLFLARFARQEEGVAYITFGMCLALFVIVLLGVELSLGATHASQEEKVSKLNEYGTFLSKEYETLYTARAACEEAGFTEACKKNGDAQARVFTKTYEAYGPVGDGNGGDEVAMSDMADYMKRSFNRAGGNEAGFRFRDIISQSVKRTCHLNSRILLTFEIAAKQYDWYVANPRNINVKVERLTKLPCDSSKLGPQPSGSAYEAPAPAKSQCSHSGPRYDKHFSNMTSFVELDKVRSIVNFIFSTDADSAALLGESNYVQRFGGALRGLSKGLGFRETAIAGALTIGNFPTGGGGVHACADNGSGLVHTSGCYDKESEFDFSGGPLDPNPGIENGSRKGDQATGTVLTGEMRAQYTRHCPSSQAVWTYRAVKGDDHCMERSYDYSPVNDSGFIGHAFASSLRDSAYQSQANADFMAAHTPAELKTFCTDRGMENAGGVSIDADRATPAGDPALCTDSGTGACMEYQMAVNCIRKGEERRDVWHGEWQPACRSTQLGGSGEAIHTSPEQVVKFRGTLTADLYNKPVTRQKVEVVGLPVKTQPKTMRAVDSDVLKQMEELQDLHVKNTERAFTWACDKGPRTDSGTLAPNAGNLTKPYGVRVGADRKLLNDAGTAPTNLASNIVNNGEGCDIPALPSSNGVMEGTVSSYDINFKRADCSGPLCDIPEGMYAMTMEPGLRALEKSGRPTGSRIPDGGLRTRWFSPDGEGGFDRWAWQEIGTVSDGLGSECPRNRDDAAACLRQITALDGTRYCGQFKYETTFVGLGGANEATCGIDGRNCDHIAQYIRRDSDDVRDWPDSAQEHLNIGAIAMERRLIEVAGKQTPYTCMIDKGESTTSQRISQVYLADSGTLNCNWKNANSRFFCEKQSNIGYDAVTPDQVEQKFIDDSDGGIFSLTADTLSGPVAIGDDKEEFAPMSRKGANNFVDKDAKSPKLVTQGAHPSLVDTGLTIVPVPVMAEETVHYRNSDDIVINYEALAIDKQVFDFRVMMVAEGYKGFDIFPNHRGNQCALFKQGMRMLDGTNAGGKEGSKFALFIGALPTNEAYRDVPAVHQANQKNATNKPGDYDGNALHLKSAGNAANPGADASVAFIRDCIGSAASPDVSSTTTPFVVTTLPPGATNGRAVLNALRDATEDTTNESCKRPYCLLSATEKDGTAWGLSADEENVLTPETCAAKVWKCVTPPDTK